MVEPKRRDVLTPEEERRLAINAAHLRRLRLTATQRDRLALAEHYRAEHGLKPPSDAELRAAGVVVRTDRPMIVRKPKREARP